MNANHACRISLFIAIIIMYLFAPFAAVTQVEAIKTIFHAPLEGFKPRITDFAISPNMKMLATCGGNTNVMLWNFETGQSIIEFQGELSGITKIGFSDDNLILAAGDGWGRVWLWDIPTQKLIHRFENPDLGFDPHPTSGHHQVMGLEISKDNRMLVLRIWRSILVWDLTTGERVKVLRDVLDSVYFGLELFPDESRIAVVDSNSLLVAGLADGETLHKFIGRGWSFSEDFRFVRALGGDAASGYRVKTWDTESGEAVESSELLGAGNLDNLTNTDIAISPKGDFIAFRNENSEGTLKTPGAESALRTFDGNAPGGLRRFKFSPDMNFLAATGGVGDGHVYVYDISDLTTGVPNATLHENE